MPAKDEYDVGRKLDFLTRLRNGAIANKISQSEDFMKYPKYTLEDCFEKALHLESRFQANEMMNLTRENQIDQAKEKKENQKQKNDEGVDVYELTDGKKEEIENLEIVINVDNQVTFQGTVLSIKEEVETHQMMIKELLGKSIISYRHIQ